MMGNHEEALRELLQFVEVAGCVTVDETLGYLRREVQDSNLYPLVDKGLITRDEAVNLLLARLQTWLESQGMHAESLKPMESPETFQRMEAFLFGEDV